jgi:hypothetical protein
MLICVQVDTVHTAGGCHAFRIEKLAAEFGADCAICIAKSHTSLLGAGNYGDQNCVVQANRVG